MARKILISDEIGLLGGECGLEERLRQHGYHNLIGADEAGRGPLAGPVVAAAVLLSEETFIEGLEDSKKLTPARRDLIFDRIVASEAAYAVGIVDNEMIDRINILRASLRAMGQAVAKLKYRHAFVLVDGNHTIPNLDFPQMAVIGGDAICPSISAASIIAKVTRDRIMDHYAKLYPDFAFARHRGYPTADHLKELRSHGPTPIHRVSFKPVGEMVSQMEMSLAR
jgi:ribonuclease HII